MKYKKLKKWLAYIGLISILVIISSIIYINYELKRMYGGHTEIVNHDTFKYVPKSVAITNVNVLSPKGNEFINGQTVLIEGGKIISINKNNNFSKNTSIIDGTEKYLIPGLIDSHVHLWESQNDLLLYIANGITQIREMNGSEDNLAWKKEIQNGRIGPEIFVSSKQLGTYGVFEGWFTNWTQKKININTSNKAKTVLKSLSDKGYDAIKISSFLSKKRYIEVSEASKEIGIPLVGHIPYSIGLKELWNSNQKELAHVEEIVKVLNKEFGQYDNKNATEFLKYVKTRSDEVASKLIENNIHITSTLWLSESFSKQKSNLKNMLSSVELSYANPGITEGTVITSRGMGWLPEVNIYRWPNDWNEKERANSKIYWETYFKAIQLIFKSFVENDVQIMAGTDTNVPVTVPGFSLHDELKTMTESGMTNSQALLSATSVPAKWMRTNTGMVEIDYNANLILLRKNPLENIENTKTIETVIINGKVINRNELDSMLRAVKKANDKSRNEEIKSFLLNK